jgi:internalin A
MNSRVKAKIEHAKKHELGLLELRNCGLYEIPKEIFECTELVSLNLGNDDFATDEIKNKIREIPEEITQLVKLSKIDLSNNCVSSIRESLARLKCLEYLHLNGNKLLDIPSKVVSMPSLKKLALEDNPFEMLPPEIIARGIDSIRNFFIELDEKDYLYEAKLLIVGEGRVGKTCLANALIDSNYKLSETDSTEGIQINRWIIRHADVTKFNDKIQRDLQINVWDFGGQEIYHSTHQFFLTKRAVYLLVTESRREDRHDDFYYWLNIIRLLGDNSPVFMVLNKCDQPTKELPIKEYMENFPNLIEFARVSLTPDYRDLFESFKNSLANIASNLPHIGHPLPKTWVDIRVDLEELKLSGRNYISEAEYFEICKKRYRTTDSALFLSEYFHDLGVMLHFQNDLELKNTVFLNHEWITKGVYKILDDRKVIAQKGRFSIDDIRRIWNENEYREKTRELLSLMKNRKFDLCFELGNGDFLVPRLLPVDEIEHNWISSPDNVRFEIHYKFMPKGILTRLIVKMNQDIDGEYYWRYGVLLEFDETKAIVKEKYFENKISIELTGKYTREFLFIIRKTINEIHRDFNQLDFEEMVPCSCQMCSNLTNPHFFQFSLLLRYEQKSMEKIVCPNSLEEVLVPKLTNEVIKGRMTNERTFVCENKNAGVLTTLGLKNILFYPERDSNSVYILMKTRPHFCGLRDRDYLLDSEITRLKKLYPNYFILEYYCFENYLFHPDNIEALKLEGFLKSDYIKDILDQKSKNKTKIISNFKKSRDSYQEFRIEAEKVRNKDKEDEIISNLESESIETFLKSFSLKDYYDKKYISRYGLKHTELASTSWFRNKMIKVLGV